MCLVQHVHFKTNLGVFRISKDRVLEHWDTIQWRWNNALIKFPELNVAEFYEKALPLFKT